MIPHTVFFFKLLSCVVDKVVLVRNAGALEAEAEGSLLIQGQPGLHYEFQASQGFAVTPSLKASKQANKQKTQTNLN